jgi:nitrite reductase/ring-hydroxylating ferredoxin subunit/DMSO/TMAO reductase YedYZ heme-binding membrane subunit
MSVQYKAVLWNRQKRIYDGVLAGAIVAYLAAFLGIYAAIHPTATIETLLIRTLATAAFLLLNFILCIGPLARLNPRFLPLLYNRRHIGVTMFVLALAHAVFATIQFHALGDVSPLASVLASNTRFSSLSQFPFQQLGLVALIILFLMAATSHDFWLHVLSPKTWKRLHMCVYFAYALIVAHISLGALQSEVSPVLAALVFASVGTVGTLHIVAGRREVRKDNMEPARGFIRVCEVDRIPEKRAVTVSIGGERIAVFRHDGKVSAISNVCRHQNGPLGEGKIIDGCITCPWHGYQYRPEDGCSPPPFKDEVPIYRTQVIGNAVFVDPQPITQPDKVLTK